MPECHTCGQIDSHSAACPERATPEKPEPVLENTQIAPAEGLAAEFKKLAAEMGEMGPALRRNSLAAAKLGSWCFVHRTDILRALKGDPQPPEKQKGHRLPAR